MLISDVQIGDGLEAIALKHIDGAYPASQPQVSRTTDAKTAVLVAPPPI